MKTKSFSFDLMEVHDEFEIFRAEINRYYPEFVITENPRIISDVLVLIIEGILDQNIFNKFKSTADDHYESLLSLLTEHRAPDELVDLIVVTNIFILFRSRVSILLKEIRSVAIDPVFAIWKVELLDKMSLNITYQGDFRIHEWHVNNNVSSTNSKYSNDLCIRNFVCTFKNWLNYGDLEYSMYGVKKSELIEAIIVEFLSTKLSNKSETGLYKELDALAAFNPELRPAFVHSRLEDFYNRNLEEEVRDAFEGILVEYFCISINSISVVHGLSKIKVAKHTQEELDQMNQHYVPRDQRSH